MLIFISNIQKELLLLVRDRVGLCLLFVMPAALVIVMSVVQDSAWKSLRGTSLEILFVDEDGAFLGKSIENGLRDSGNFSVIKQIKDRPLTRESAVAAVAAGKYQACVVISAGATTKAQKKAAEFAKKNMRTAMAGFLPSGWESAVDRSTPDEAGGNGIIVYLDPAISGSFRISVVSHIKMLIQGAAMKMIFETYANAPQGISPEDEKPLDHEGIVGLTEVFAATKGAKIIPTSVQQNVPAWTMFAMFFVVIPLSGAFIREHDEGTINRLRTMPVSYIVVMLSKIFVYVMVCMAQFGQMLLIGMFLLPAFGLPALELSGGNLIPALFVALASALAATGFGTLFGTIFRTHDQASSFGAISVVIAAAIGGVMVPAFVMPKFMQQLSLISPLGWGLEAFLDILVRGGSVNTALPQMALLFAFFVVTIAISHIIFRKKYSI